MAKRWIALILSVLLLLPLLQLAAAEEEPKPSQTETDEAPQPTETDAPAPEETDEPIPEETGAPIPEETDEPAPETTEEPTPEEPPVTGLDAFAVDVYTPLPFTDVPKTAYYYKAVSAFYTLGLASGTTTNRFSPKSRLTLAQCVSFAVLVRARYEGITPDLTRLPGEPWYGPCMRLAAQWDLLPAGVSPTATVTRLQALYVLWRTLPQEHLEPIRACWRVPGLFPSNPQYGEILALYRAGIISGSDAYGTFIGDAAVTRAQFITMLSALVKCTPRASAPILLKTGLEAFQAAEAPSDYPFTDVTPDKYYAPGLAKLYNMGLFAGTTPTTFSPNKNTALKHAVRLAVRIYEIYHGKTDSCGLSSVNDVIALARRYGMIPADWTNFDKNATRAQVAHLIYKALPASELTVLRNMSKLPDAATAAPFGSEVLALYRAGILTGKDEKENFRGTEPITRAEFSAIVAALVMPELRVKPDLSKVRQAAEKAIRGYSGEWSVYLSDITSGQSFSINNKRMWSASVVKLYVMGAILEALENGTLQNSSTIQQELRLMITVSSNDAWHSLASRLANGQYFPGMKVVTDWCDAHDYHDSGTRVSTSFYHTTSVEDCGLFLERILDRTNVSPEASDQMLELLKAQTRTTKIPAGVPSGVVTANKTGEISVAQNDAAIIFAPFGTYVLVVLTDHGSAANIRSLSTVVYNALRDCIG